MTQPPPVAGLQPVAGRLVEEFVARPEGRSRALPIVVSVGARATGKTTLLEALRARCRDAPHAVVDFERHEHIRPKEVLSALAFDLSRHWPQFGRLAFPRLWLCLLVVASPGRTDDRAAALSDLRKLLAQNRPIEKNRDAVMELLRLAGGVATGRALPGWAEPATDLLLRGLGWADRKRLLADIKRISTGPGKPEDALIDLAMRARGDEEDRADVDATFCEAFLADLRRAYSGVSGSRRTLNSVVLLDNTQAAAGRAFLRALRQARSRSTEGPDPLAVFATSRSWNADWNESWHRVGAHRVSDDESLRPATHRTGGIDWPTPRLPHQVDEDWPDTDSPEHRWYPWYLIQLGLLSLDDTTVLAAGHDVHPATEIPGFVHRLTSGHPGAVVDVLSATAGVPYRERPNELRKTFELPIPRKQRPGEPAGRGEQNALIAEVRAQLLRDFEGATIRRDLVTASAAREVDLLFQPEILRSAFPDGEGSLFKLLSDNLWLTTETQADTTRYALHPWLRRVLLHELAERPEDDRLSWTNVHTMCRDFYAKNGRVRNARYHDMALGNLAEIVAYLRQPFDARHAEFDVPGAVAWLADLDVITSAPNRLAKHDEPYHQVQASVGQWSQELETTLAWLVVSLWIANDPLGDPGHTLYSTIATGLHRLAQGRGRGSMLLHERAERYE